MLSVTDDHYQRAVLSRIPAFIGINKANVSAVRNDFQKLHKLTRGYIMVFITRLSFDYISLASLYISCIAFVKNHFVVFRQWVGDSHNFFPCI